MSKQAGVGISFLGLGLSGQTLKKVGTIDLPDPQGRALDYLTMDQEDHYLLSAHLGPGILNVIDVQTNTLGKVDPWACPASMRPAPEE